MFYNKKAVHSQHTPKPPKWSNCSWKVRSLAGSSLLLILLATLQIMLHLATKWNAPHPSPHEVTSMENTINATNKFTITLIWDYQHIFWTASHCSKFVLPALLMVLQSMLLEHLEGSVLEPLVHFLSGKTITIKTNYIPTLEFFTGNRFGFFLLIIKT